MGLEFKLQFADLNRRHTTREMNFWFADISRKGAKTYLSRKENKIQTRQVSKASVKRLQCI
jgi:hypothetical protein